MMHESLFMYSAVVSTGPECFPVSLVKVEGNRLRLSYVENLSFLNKDMQAEICARNTDWVMHVKGTISEITSEDKQFVFQILSGTMVNISSGVEQKLAFD